MLEVTVKTLDSQNHSFSVPDETTVKEFKDHIAPVLNITSDKQRLIFCGKVLKDDKKLTEYDVNGKVIHVVQSLPPQQGGSTRSQSSNSGTGNNPGSGNTNPTGLRGHRDAAGFLLGAFTIPQDLVDPTQVQTIVQDVVSGMGEIGRNATVMSRASDDGSVDVHINLGRVPVQVPLQSEAQLRMNRVQTMLIRANHLLESLEDGANSNNGNVADSSSQTETGNGESRENPMEAQVVNSTTADEIPNGSEASSSSEESTLNNELQIDSEVTSEINLDESEVPSSSDGFVRLEGLAHAAQAAISAAFATAAAAARAASTSVSTTTTTATDDSVPSSGAEPMDATPSVIQDPTVISMDSLPSDSEPAVPETATESDSQPESEATNNRQPSPPISTARTSTGARRTNFVQPSVTTLANLLDKVINVNTRLQPCLERCSELIRADSTLTGRALGDAHRLFSRISQLMHFLSHAYHSLSDLHINFSQVPPRSPRVRIMHSSTNGSSIFQGIPMQAQISISTSSGFIPTPNQPTTTTAATSSTNSDATQNSTSEPRPVPAPRTSTPVNVALNNSVPPPTTTAPPPATTAPLSSTLDFMSRSATPVVFMDVLPASVSIDGIASSMLPGSSAFNTTVPSLFGLPPRVSATTANQDTSTTTANSTDTTPPVTRISTPTVTPATTASQGPTPINIPFRNLIPVPLTSMGSMPTFDSSLPCHSVWALEASRRRHNASNQGSRISPNAPSGVTPNIPGRQEEQLQQVISNIMMSLLNGAPNQTAGNPVPAGFTVFTSRSDSPTREGSIFVNAQANSSTTSADSIGSSINTTPSASLDLIARNYRATETFFSRNGMINKPLSEILPNMTFSEFGIVANFLTFLARNVTLKDANALSFEKADLFPWVRLQSDVKNYLKETVIRNLNLTPEEMDGLVTLIELEIKDYMQPFLDRLINRPGKNFENALHGFLSAGIRRILELASEQSEIELWSKSSSIIKQFFDLLKECTVNGVIALVSLAKSKAETLIRDRLHLYGYEGLNRWLTYAIDKFFHFFASSNVADSSRLPTTVPTRSTAQQRKGNEARSSQSSLNYGTRPNRNNSGLRRVDLADALEVIEGSSATILPYMRYSSLYRSDNQLANDRSDTNVAEVVIGSEPWHTSVPRDWVPIIARDVGRQRRQAPQAPFSDAYLSGMPSKRRKIMTNGNATLLEPSQSALSDMLLQAISSADVKPKTNLEEIKKEASQDVALQASFTDHMKHSIQERLQRDLDYCSEKFPNSEKYFN